LFNGGMIRELVIMLCKHSWRILGHGPQFYIDLQSRPEDADPPGYHERHEREANDFAANVLMPGGDRSNEFRPTKGGRAVGALIRR
jgi:hypothetical protein